MNDNEEREFDEITQHPSMGDLKGQGRAKAAAVVMVWGMAATVLVFGVLAVLLTSWKIAVAGFVVCVALLLACAAASLGSSS